MNSKKFIVVKDQYTANKLIAHGFNLISNISGVYTFMNIVPEHFNFEEIDIKKLAYTDRLAF